ncbi:Lcl C-terminal domain-containing protein [Leptospira sp. GIMC2001]|uniref:Lcl C-terminal domain-containing protein n=1 Tax=Leptospira sp. GIMC2001 TaxID=1513297 RepID=UPI00234BD4BA|nr:DUF1566 domain-containing protein [Leptospira sp. GIMC2001]WCL50304.1 DUF1566 domain-containing protein [Leptospira sp. GIMC2001]
MEPFLGCTRIQLTRLISYGLIHLLAFLILNCQLEQDADMLFVLPLANAAGSNSDEDSSNPCELNFTSYSFGSTTNSLSSNYTGTISTNSVAINLPYGRIVRAIADFQTTENTAVQISETTQVSASTSNDFSNPVAYTLSRANCPNATITVNVTPLSPVPETGLANCYDSTSMQTCNAVSTTHPRQDGSVASANGRSLLASASTTFNDRITVDQVTGLIWNSCLIGQDPTTNCGGAATGMNQDDAITNCSDLNNRNSGSGYGGLKFWRLPTIQELMYITYHNDGEPFIHTTRFPQIAATNSVWSSTIDPNDASEGYRLRFVDGNFLNQRTDSGIRFALCVSGGATPSRSLSIVNDEEVNDLRTGLTWKRCTSGRTYPGCTGANPNPNWQAALQDCSNLGGRWRLPNSHELVSLFDYSNATNGIEGSFFPNVTPSVQYWSATTSSHAGSQAGAFAMNSLGEVVTNLTKSTAANIKAYCVQDSN